MPKLKPEQTLDEKQVFLLLFARELIRNSEEGLLQLKRILEQEAGKPLAEVPEQNLEILNQPEFPLIKSILSAMPRITMDGEFAAVKPVYIKSQRREISNGYGRIEYPVLRIPEPRLPEQLSYLKPVVSVREIDLNKLNSLIYDAGVKKIECDGPNKPVIVSGGMGRKPTEIILSSNEIDDIVERFSKAARIPVDVGIFRVVVGNLIFSAIISDVVPSRFTITKMAPAAQMNFRYMPRAMPPPAVKMSYADYIKPA